MTKLDLKKVISGEELREAIVYFKKNGWAARAQEEPFGREGHRIVLTRGNLFYVDEYHADAQAPGIEQVFIQPGGKLIWQMAYWGGMLPQFRQDKKLTAEIFDFLRDDVLSKVTPELPFRGPAYDIIKEDLIYSCRVNGDISYFSGSEGINKNKHMVFRQGFGGCSLIEI